MSERPRPSIESKDDREPFKIRGHHIPQFKKLIGNKNFHYSPKDLAAGLTRVYGDKDFLPKALREDTVGKTQKEANRFEKSAENIFREFLMLPDDHPLELTENQKDEICNRCTIKGEHCTTRNMASFGIEVYTLDQDRMSIDLFLSKAKKYFFHNFEITEDFAEFSDTEPEKVRKIKTTAGTFKKVLSFWNNELLLNS